MAVHVLRYGFAQDDCLHAPNVLTESSADTVNGLVAGDDIDPEEYTPAVLHRVVPASIRNLIEVQLLCPRPQPA